MTQKEKRFFTLALPAELVEKLDAQAKYLYSTRTQYIKDAIVERLKKEDALCEPPVDYSEIRQQQLRHYMRKTITKNYFTEDMN